MVGAEMHLAVEHDRQLAGRAGRRGFGLHWRGRGVEQVDAVGAALERRG